MSRLTALSAYRTAIPMRSFEHAAAGREQAESIVVRIACSDGRVGWGETLPRPYVTGETLESVEADLAGTLWPACRSLELPADGDAPGACTFFESLPIVDETGRAIPAATAAVELAALDCLWSGGFARSVLTDAFGGRGLRLGRLGVRVSGVLGSRDADRTRCRLRLMRLGGLRDFKLKLGLGQEADEANLRLVCDALGGGLRRGRLTLRVDVNGGWTAEETPARSVDLAGRGVCVIEQPVFCPAGELAELAGRCGLPLMADESLITSGDADALLGSNTWWNLRISKNGGLLRTLRLAARGADADVPVTIGCMVGESGILSLAQRRLLQLVGTPRFVEGNYGRLLLGDDLTRPSPRFGLGGRLRAAGRGPWSRTVDPRAIARLARPVLSLEA